MHSLKPQTPLCEDGSDPRLGGTEGLTLTLCRLCGLSWLILASEGPWPRVCLGAAQRALTSEGCPLTAEARAPGGGRSCLALHEWR